MKNLKFAHLLVAITIGSFSLCGCSSSEPTSVTEGVEQSEIDKYKEMEKQLELEAMKEMDLK